jgi:hypothetical protein
MPDILIQDILKTHVIKRGRFSPKNLADVYKKIEKLRNQKVFGSEADFSAVKQAILKLEALKVKLEIESRKIDQLDYSFLGYQKQNGLPGFVIFGIDTTRFEICVKPVAPIGAYAYKEEKDIKPDPTRSQVTFYTAAGILIRNQYQPSVNFMLSLAAEKYRWDSIYISTESDHPALMTDELRQRINTHKGLFDELYVIQVAPIWQINKGVALENNFRLVVGWARSQMFLIDSYNPMTMQEYVDSI